MGQCTTRPTGGIEKIDINEDYQTYGEGDNYAMDANDYYQPSDYNEETSGRKSTRRFTRLKV